MGPSLSMLVLISLCGNYVVPLQCNTSYHDVSRRKSSTYRSGTDQPDPTSVSFFLYVIIV